jgi:hypothetical protein
MKTRSTKAFGAFDVFRRIFDRLQQGSIAAICLSAAFLFSTRVFAGPIANFILPFPTVYIQAGLEENPDLGSHPFILPIGPPTYWDALPAALTVDGSTYGHVGSSTHIYAPHPGDIVPSTTWDYDFTVQAWRSWPGAYSPRAIWPRP